MAANTALPRPVKDAIVKEPPPNGLQRFPRAAVRVSRHTFRPRAKVLQALGVIGHLTPRSVCGAVAVLMRASRPSAVEAVEGRPPQETTPLALEGCVAMPPSRLGVSP